MEEGGGGGGRGVEEGGMEAVRERKWGEKEERERERGRRENISPYSQARVVLFTTGLFKK